MLGNNFLRKFIADSAGFTLMEVVVAMGLLSLAVSMVGAGIFQTIRAEAFWQDGVVATRDLRHAGSWFAGDVLSAKTTDLVDGDPAVTSVILSTFTTDETITYSVLANELIRSHFDGVATTVENRLANNVESVSFLLTGDVLEMTLVVNTDGTNNDTNTESMSLNTKLR